MTIVWFVGGLVLTLIGLACSVGALLPRDHVATGSVVVNASPEAVWHSIRDVAAAPSWRPSVKAIDSVQGEPGRAARWTERGDNGSLTMIVDEESQTSRLVTRIDDAKLPFGGSWTFELTPEPTGTRARITERGYIKLPPMRAMAKLFMDPKATLTTYLKDLAAKHGGGSVEN